MGQCLRHHWDTQLMPPAGRLSTGERQYIIKHTLLFFVILMDHWSLSCACYRQVKYFLLSFCKQNTKLSTWSQTHFWFSEIYMFFFPWVLATSKLQNCEERGGEKAREQKWDREKRRREVLVTSWDLIISSSSSLLLWLSPSSFSLSSPTFLPTFFLPSLLPLPSMYSGPPMCWLLISEDYNKVTNQQCMSSNYEPFMSMPCSLSNTSWEDAPLANPPPSSLSLSRTMPLHFLSSSTLSLYGSALSLLLLSRLLPWQL